MFVFRGFFIVLHVFFTSEFVFADPMYKPFGGSVVLDPGYKSGLIKSITWKHQEDLALDLIEGQITYYRTFKGRCELDKTTGSFTIKNLTLADSGKYTPEINNAVGDTMELKVIKPVPKPTISMDCNKEKKLCDLTCEANISSEFGPVTYKWKTGDTELSNDKKLSIEHSIAVKNESFFFCVLTNPVSNSTSNKFSIPTSSEINAAAVVVPVVFGLILIVLGVFACVKYRRDPRVKAMWPFKYFSKSQDNAAPGQGQDNAAPGQGQDNAAPGQGQDNPAPGQGESLLVVSETTTEDNSKGKEPLNGYQPVEVHEDDSNRAK